MARRAPEPIPPPSSPSATSTSPAIVADAASPGATARNKARRLMPITGSDISTVAPSRTAMPPSQAQASPSIPHWMPARKASGISSAPTRPVRTAMPGRPSALSARSRASSIVPTM